MITDADREKAGQIVEATWADFMQAQNTPFYRPTAELWAAMACMALSGIACERKAQEVVRVAVVEGEREACAKVVEEKSADGEWYIRLFADDVAEEIRARSAPS